MRRIAWLLVGAVGLLVPGLWGQRYRFRTYTQEDGLGNLAVLSVLQDRTGYLWVGTQNGLYRFDGTEFRGYGMQDGLPSSRIHALHEARDGTLWVATRD